MCNSSSSGEEEGAIVTSMIAPLRGKRDVGATGRVCTAQAGVAALLALGWEPEHASDALARVRARVRICLALRGKRGAKEAVKANKHFRPR